MWVFNDMSKNRAKQITRKMKKNHERRIVSERELKCISVKIKMKDYI